MQVGSLKTGELYQYDDIPKDQRGWHRIGLVEMLRDGTGNKIGLITLAHDGILDLEEQGLLDRLH